MHPPLSDKKSIVCKEFIEALINCHEGHYWSKYLGSCNDEKQALNMCLRTERLERSARNRESAKKQHERWEVARKKLDEDSDAVEVS